MNPASIAKNEYLKKYLSGSVKPDKKKKKKHGQIKGAGMKIIDDDVDLSKMRVLEEDELDFLGGGEDAPQVAGIVDDRPAEVKRLEQFSRDKWKVINEDDGFNSTLTVQQLSTKNGRSPSPDSDQSVTRTQIKKEIRRHSPDSDQSVPRTKRTEERNRSATPDSDQSVQRTKQNEEVRERKRSPSPDSDLSVSRKKRKETRGKERDERKRSASPPDSDQSVPRTKKKEVRGRDKRQRQESPTPDSDQSVPRTKRKEVRGRDKAQRQKSPSPDSDQSVPRTKRKEVRGRDKAQRQKSPSPDSDQSVPRTKRKDEVRGKVPIKKERNRSLTPDSDQSVPRRIKEEVRVKERAYKKKSRWADPDEELGQQILENLHRNDYERGDRNEDKRGGRNQDWRGDRNENRRGDRNEEKRGDRNEERRGYRNEERRGDRNEERRDRNEERRGDRTESNNRDNGRSDRTVDGRRDRGAEDRVPKLMEKTLDGKRAGLQNAGQLKAESLDFRRREAELFENLPEELSGRNAKTIKRDLKGKRETEEDRQNQRDKEAKDKEMEAKYSQWGKGLKQVEDQAANLRDYVHEASKPLARHRDDRDLESALRQKERDGDPMLEYMRRKETEKGIQDGVPARPLYKGPYPPNRFDIRPGHRWDGVDRSNGHEAAVFQARSSKKAMDADQYKWSTEDM